MRWVAGTPGGLRARRHGAYDRRKRSIRVRRPICGDASGSGEAAGSRRGKRADGRQPLRLPASRSRRLVRTDDGNTGLRACALVGRQQGHGGGAPHHPARGSKRLPEPLQDRRDGSQWRAALRLPNDAVRRDTDRHRARRGLRASGGAARELGPGQGVLHEPPRGRRASRPTGGEAGRRWRRAERGPDPGHPGPERPT